MKCLHCGNDFIGKQIDREVAIATAGLVAAAEALIESLDDGRDGRQLRIVQTCDFGKERTALEAAIAKAKGPA